MEDTLSKEQTDLLRRLKKSGGFKIYLLCLEDRFNKEYKRLRKCSRDKTFERINGFLDGIEHAMTLVSNTVEESTNPDGSDEGEDNE